jgi:hypothetical protein
MHSYASQEPHTIGTAIFKGFAELDNTDSLDNAIKPGQLLTAAERFRLWAHSLGLHQSGHASLDYRVRDTVVLKDRFAELLIKLQEQI